MSLVFTPRQPLRESKVFAGRDRERDIFIKAISSFGRQIVVFGSRGVGKTSFVNVLLKGDKNSLVVQCEEQDSLESLASKILQRIEESSVSMTTTRSLEAEAAANVGIFKAGTGARQHTSITKNITLGKNVDSIVYALEKLEHLGKSFRIVFDEMDKISNLQTRSDLARLVKAFSDRLQETKLIFIGVAETVSDLLELHPSNTRSLLDIELKPMSEAELKDILTKAESSLDFSFEVGLKEKIVAIAEGLPFFVHLLGEGIELHHADDTVARESEFDTYAIPHAYENANHSLKNKYEEIARASDVQKLVLWVCAQYLHKTDIRRKDIKVDYESILGREITDQSLSQPLGSLNTKGILDNISTGFYKFKDPMFKIYCNIARRKEAEQQSFFPS